MIKYRLKVTEDVTPWEHTSRFDSPKYSWGKWHFLKPLTTLKHLIINFMFSVQICQQKQQLYLFCVQTTPGPHAELQIQPQNLKHIENLSVLQILVQVMFLCSCFVLTLNWRKRLCSFVYSLQCGSACWHTDLFGLVRLQVVWFQQLYVEIFEGLSEGRVDFVIQFRQFQELRIDWWNELNTEESIW